MTHRDAGSDGGTVVDLSNNWPRPADISAAARPSRLTSCDIAGGVSVAMSGRVRVWSRTAWLEPDRSVSR